MTWQWVILILGVVFALVALLSFQFFVESNNKAKLKAHKLQYLDPNDIIGLE